MGTFCWEPQRYLFLQYKETLTLYASYQFTQWRPLNTLMCIISICAFSSVLAILLHNLISFSRCVFQFIKKKTKSSPLQQHMECARKKSMEWSYLHILKIRIYYAWYNIHIQRIHPHANYHTIDHLIDSLTHLGIWTFAFRPFE